MNISTAAAIAETTSNLDSNHHHDTHAMPPEFIQKVHWHYSAVKKATLDFDEDVIDFRGGLTVKQKQDLQPVETMSTTQIQTACDAYKKAYIESSDPVDDVSNVTVYEHKEFPGKRGRLRIVGSS
jgi:hypothetical protein